MRDNKSLMSLGSALLTVTVAFLVLAPGAWAAPKYKTLHKFTSCNYGGPQAGLIFDGAGNLYGTTSHCGAYDRGTVFKLTPKSDGWSESVLYSFCSLSSCGDGSLPEAGLILDQAGNLYGTTTNGGPNARGVAFELTHSPDGSWRESILYAFCSLSNCGDGAFPEAGLIFDQAGNLYGTTQWGGSSSTCTDGCGTVFRLTPRSDGSWSESVLYNFCSLNGCRDGQQPFAPVTFDQEGNLYGTTQSGAATGDGVVFQLAPNSDGSWKENVLHTFRGRDGSYLSAGLIFDQRGNLYGTACGGGGANADGVVFQLGPNPDGSWRENVLHTFTGRDGSCPYAALTFDRAGNLYSTTFQGGIGQGVVFKLVLNSKGEWREKVLHVFQDHPGALPSANVTLDAAGNIYGTTSGDSNTTFGSVFEIMP